MIAIRRARPADAPSIGAVHVAAWRSAYPGILPDSYLANLSVARQAAHYDQVIRDGEGVFVVCASGDDLPPPSGHSAENNAGHHSPRRVPSPVRVVGFTTAVRAPTGALGQGEIETLYVLDDYRERGLGRRLLRAGASHLRTLGCRTAFLWVLSDNPSRWFYAHMRGVPVARSEARLAGAVLEREAFLWDPIEILLHPQMPRDAGQEGR